MTDSNALSEPLIINDPTKDDDAPVEENKVDEIAKTKAEAESTRQTYAILFIVLLALEVAAMGVAIIEHLLRDRGMIGGEKTWIAVFASLASFHLGLEIGVLIYGSELTPKYDRFVRPIALGAFGFGFNSYATVRMLVIDQTSDAHTNDIDYRDTLSDFVLATLVAILFTVVTLEDLQVRKLKFPSKAKSSSDNPIVNPIASGIKTKGGV